MSLISEGLKKAQLDAMRQDRQQRGAYLGSARAGVAARSSLPQMLLIGIGSAVITSMAILGVVRASSHAPEGSAPEVRTTPAPVTTPKIAPIVVEPKPEPVAPSGGSASAVRAAKVERAPSQPERAKRVTRRDRFVDGETYPSPINGPGGIEVSVSGIVGAGDQVLAIINGRSVRAGAMVGPFVVENIERRRVQLRYIDVRFYLTP